jgi:hypothetical protein
MKSGIMLNDFWYCVHRNEKEEEASPPVSLANYLKRGLESSG